MQEISLRYGEKTVVCALPEEKIVDIVQGKSCPAIVDIPAAVRGVLHHPTGALPLAETVRPGNRVAVVVSDITRPVHYEKFLPVLLDELNAAGVPDKDITLVVALGAHRPHTDAEHQRVYGEEAARRVRIIQSEARQEDQFVYVGRTAGGVNVRLHQAVVGADKVILTGGIAYHSMAGFGGGRKAVIPGISSYSTIQANHSFCLAAAKGAGLNPCCDSGRVADNPMHQDMLAIAAMLRPAFLLNAVYTPAGRFARFVAGHWLKAWQEGCRTVQEIYGVPVSGPADVVIVSAGGYPKDINLYQGSKAIENALPIVKPGGVIIALLECREILDPPDFSDWFGYRSLFDREMALRSAFTVPGFVALKLGYAAAQTHIVLVTRPENCEFIRKAGLSYAASLDEALEKACDWLGGGYTVTVMPEGGCTLPLLKK